MLNITPITIPDIEPINPIETPIVKNIENDLRDIDGISQIKVSGFPDEEIEIAINDKKLIEYELTFADISTAVKSSNILISGGNIKTSD